MPVVFFPKKNQIKNESQWRMSIRPKFYKDKLKKKICMVFRYDTRHIFKQILFKFYIKNPGFI